MIDFSKIHAQPGLRSLMRPLSPEDERMSPENQWLVQMYFLLKIRPFLGDIG